MNIDVKKEILSRAREKIGKPIYEVSDKFAQPAISFFLIQNDLLEIIVCLEKAEKYKDIDEDIVSAFWKSAIITYGKIFSSSNEGYSSLNKIKVIKDHQIELHDKLIFLRNNYVAHRGKSGIENSILIVHEENDKNSISLNFSIPSVFQIGHLVANISEIKDLIVDLLKMIEDKIIQKLKKVENVIIKEQIQNGLIHPINENESSI